MPAFSAALIEEARRVLDGQILTTPVEPSNIPGVLFKCEHLQRTGSFKIRGAFFRLSQLTPAERARGVLTCSAGNHGKAVAYAGKLLGIPAVVCLPNSVDTAKQRAIESPGAQVRIAPFSGYDDSEAWAKNMAAEQSLPFLSAFDDPCIMAGNGGTLAAEVFEQAPDASTFLLPVGGGGLAAGFAYVAKSRNPRCTIIACQLEASPALALSLSRGEAVTSLPAVETLAGGLEGGIGTQTFAILQDRVDRVALVTEEEIAEGVQWVFDHHQYLIEPSAAATVAAILSGKAGALHSPAVAILSGRNVSGEIARTILNRRPARPAATQP
jgi:threonine dehydratase